MNNTITLNNGIKIPRLGLGVFRVEDSTLESFIMIVNNNMEK